MARADSLRTYGAFCHHSQPNHPAIILTHWIWDETNLLTVQSDRPDITPDTRPPPGLPPGPQPLYHYPAPPPQQPTEAHGAAPPLQPNYNYK